MQNFTTSKVFFPFRHPLTLKKMKHRPDFGVNRRSQIKRNSSEIKEVTLLLYQHEGEKNKDLIIIIQTTRVTMEVSIIHYIFRWQNK